jgi:hypothetical protein
MDDGCAFVSYRVFVLPGQGGVVQEHIARLRNRPTFPEVKAIVVPLLGTEQVNYELVPCFNRLTPVFYDEDGFHKGRPRNEALDGIVHATQFFGPVVVFEKIVLH